MKRPLPEELLGRFAELVAARLGLDFTQHRLKDLERGLRAATPDFGFDDPAACAAWLLSAPLTAERTAVLARRLTVGETYFFRDNPIFAALEQRILPEMIARRRAAGRHLRLWSAGCCTGEEAYSLALLVERLLPDLKDWRVSILGTDINPAFLEKAARGEYGAWSFRDAPPGLRERSFRTTGGGRFEVPPKTRKLVTFAVHNLVEDCASSVGINTGAMDLILCRNVLMYFTPAQRERVAGTLARCLAGGGALIVSPSESSDALFAPLAARRLSGMAIYEKIRHCGAAGPPPIVEAEAPRDAGVERGWTPQGQAPPALTLARLLVPEERPEQRPEERKDEESTEARARRLANEGRLDEALLQCRRAVEENKCDPEAYVLLAAILLELDRPPEAVEQLKKALYLDQGFVIAHVMLGNIESRQGRRAQGRRHLRNACILLEGRPWEEIVCGSAGLTAARLLEIIRSTPGEGLE